MLVISLVPSSAATPTVSSRVEYRVGEILECVVEEDELVAGVELVTQLVLDREKDCAANVYFVEC